MLSYFEKTLNDEYDCASLQCFRQWVNTFLTVSVFVLDFVGTVLVAFLCVS